MQWPWVVSSLIAIAAIVVPVVVSRRDKPRAGLHVERLIVTAGRVTEAQEVEPSAVDIVVQNQGGLVATVTSTTVTVRGFEVIEFCEGGAALTSTAQYDVRLPIEDPVGTVIRVDTVHVVEPNGADRFRLTFNVPDHALWDATRLYLLDVALTAGSEAIPAGAAVIAAPTVPPGFAVSGDGANAPGAVGECYRRNADAYARASRWEGERADGWP